MVDLLKEGGETNDAIKEAVLGNDLHIKRFSSRARLYKALDARQ
jgi:hypothetical protein